MQEIKLFIMNNKKVFIMPLIIVIGILIYVSYFNDSVDNNIVYENLAQDSVYTKNSYQVETANEYISVDIKGKIKNPGVYKVDLKLDRRVNDIIIMAGGLLKEADTSVTNLSKKLYDEMVIIIYSKDEVKRFTEAKEKEVLKNNECLQNSCDSCIENENITDNTTNKDVTLININTASKETLMTLSGIGESKALAIIEYRKETPFKNKEDIMNVSGIGESAYKKIKDNITV